MKGGVIVGAKLIKGAKVGAVTGGIGSALLGKGALHFGGKALHFGSKAALKGKLALALAGAAGAPILVPAAAMAAASGPLGKALGVPLGFLGGEALDRLIPIVSLVFNL